MKIQVLKKANGKTRSTDPVPVSVEMPPEAAKK